MGSKEIVHRIIGGVVAQLLLTIGILGAAECGGCNTSCYEGFVEPLYWMTSEAADWCRVVLPSDTDEKVTYHVVDFDWTPGFRIGVGYQMNHDAWDTQFSYTRFHTQANNDAESDGPNVESIFFGSKILNVGKYNTAKLKLNLGYDMIDWDLGRSFCWSEALVLRPYIGIKGGWISQTLDTQWDKLVDLIIVTVPFTAKEKIQNDFRGVGPKLGISSQWYLRTSARCCFSLIGDFACAYMWGNWSIKGKYHDTFDRTMITLQKNRNFGALMVQGFIGIGCEYSCYSIKLGYEIQDWFNQYQVYDNDTGGHENDLIFQGLTLDLRKYF